MPPLIPSTWMPLDLRDEDLKELGVPMGSHKKLLRAVEGLRARSSRHPSPGLVLSSNGMRTPHHFEARSVACAECIGPREAGDVSRGFRRQARKNVSISCDFDVK